jgi:hypothetical protein
MISIFQRPNIVEVRDLIEENRHMCVYGHVVKSNKELRTGRNETMAASSKVLPPASQLSKQGRGRATQLEDMKPKHLYTSAYSCPS